VSQGYTGDGAESSDPLGGKSHKECYEHRKVNKLCPAAGELDEWTTWADSFHKVCQSLLPTSTVLLTCTEIARPGRTRRLGTGHGSRTGC